MKPTHESNTQLVASVKSTRSKYDEICFPTPACSKITLPGNLSNGWEINNPLLFLLKLIAPPGLQPLHLAKGPKS